MSIITAYSTNSSIEQAVNEIKEKLSGAFPKLVLFFASAVYDGGQLSAKMKEAFPEAVSLGCSTAGEIVTGKMLNNSIVAMGLGSDIIVDANVAVVDDIKGDVKANVEKAVKELEGYYSKSLRELSNEEYVGIVLHDGMVGAEERVMDELGNLSDITFIGGSAGDDCKFVSTQVFAEGKVYSNASILAVLKAGTKFDIIKTQSFCPSNKKLVATKVNEPDREILEFNGQPASEAYAEALGISVSDLANHFMTNPIGILAGDDIFVRSPQQIKDGKVVFYCAIKEGMELDILEATDIVKDTQKAVEVKKSELGSISALINFHCILRTLQLNTEGNAEDYGNIFSDIPTIGFSTYGESYIGHINQTSIMLVFK